MDDKLVVQVPSTIRPNAVIGIVGEAPGREEVAQRKGFVGKAGKALNYALRGADLNRDQDVSLFNVVKRIPEGGPTSEAFKQEFYFLHETPTYTKTGKISKKPHVTVTPTNKLLTYTELLGREIRECGLKVIVAAGNEAVRALCGPQRFGITLLRGSVIPSTLVPGVLVVPVVHPAQIYHSAEWGNVYVLQADLRKAATIAKGTFKTHEIYTLTRPTFEQVRTLFDNLMKADKWCIDLEMWRWTNEISCMGFAYFDSLGRLHAVCVPMFSSKGPYWTASQEANILLMLEKLFNENPNVTNHNIVADLTWLLPLGIQPSALVHDTMIKAFVLSPESRKSLAFVSSMYTDAVYWKHVGKKLDKEMEEEVRGWDDKISDEDLWTYNCRDVAYTLWCDEELDEELKAEGLWDLYNGYGRRLIPICIELQQRGLLCDKDKMMHIRTVLLEEFSRLSIDLTKSTGGININSPKQVQEWVYTTLGLPARHKRGTGKLTADEDALIDLYLTYPEKAAPLIPLLKGKHLLKALSSYANL